MLRTTVVGSWPVDDRFRESMGRYHRGELSGDEGEALLREVAAVAIAQQVACGLDEHTGGETSVDHFILDFPHRLAGVEPIGDTGAWYGRGTYRVVGPVGAPRGLGLADALRRERGIDPAIAKATIPGPSEITMMIEPEEARAALQPVATGLIREEIRRLVDAGARDVQLDAPHIAMGLADGWWDLETAAETVRDIFAGFDGVRRSLHLCYGDFEARSWVGNPALRPLIPLVQSLEGIVDRVVLELSLPEQWAQRALLGEIPSGMEVAAGIVDVKSPVVESDAQLRERIGELLLYVPADRLLICPSCGLGRRDVALATAKATAMVRAARSAGAQDQVRATGGEGL